MIEGDFAKESELKAIEKKIEINFFQSNNELSKLLVKEGFLTSVKKVKKDFDELEITLKYFNEEPVIKELVRESRPGLRKYLSYKDVKPYKGGLGLKVLTTSKGLMTDKDAIKKQLGGEVICRVF